MTEAGLVEAQYFAPWLIGLYLFVIFVFMVVYFQWKWAKTRDNNIQVLVAQQGGGGDFFLAPKSGGFVEIKNPKTDEVRVWPVNELATIEVPYPGVGFVPAFLQKTIRLAIVNEGDWEPMLNRSPHREKIASPDVVEFLLALAEDTEDAKKKAVILKMVKGLSTGPTREMIADPAILGNLMRSSIMKALATVSTDLVEQLKAVNAKLGKAGGLNPRIVYIGLGLITILLAFTLYQIMPIVSSIGDLGSLSDKLDAIMKALGVLTGGQ